MSTPSPIGDGAAQRGPSQPYQWVGWRAVGSLLARPLGDDTIRVMVVPTSPARHDRLPELTSVRHRWLDVGRDDTGVRLHLAETGSGWPVLLLHGWPQHWWCWRRVIEQLRGEYRLLVPDLRGFGWSEAPGSGYTAATFAHDAVALLDVLGIERAHVVGHDWGGFTGILLGLEYPERVGRLLLCNTPVPWAALNPRVVVGMRRAWYAALLSVPMVGEQVVARRWFIPWFVRLGGQAGLFGEAEVEVYAAQFRDPARAAATSRLYRHYLGMAQAVLIRRAFGERRLAATTRLLVGADDFYIPVALTEGAAAHGDDLAVEVVTGGHWMPEERPELIAKRARALFE